MSLRNQFKKYRDLAKSAKGEIFWVLLGQGIAFVGGFAGIKLLTNTISLESYGELSLGISIAGIMNLFLYGPLANSVMRFYSIFKEKNNVELYFSTIKKAHLRFLILILVIGVPAVVGTIFIKGIFWGFLLFFAILFGVTNGVNGSFMSFLGATRQRKLMALHQAADTCIRPIFAILIVKFVMDKGAFALSGYVLASAIIVLSQFYFFLKKQKQTRLAVVDHETIESKQAFNDFTNYSKGFIYIGLFGVLSSYADRWMLQYFMGEKSVGVYAVITQIATAPISVVGGMISQFMVPIIFEHAGSMTTVDQVAKSKKLLYKTALIYCVIILVITLLAYFFGHSLILLLATKEVAQYHQVLWIMCLSQFWSGLAELLAVSGFKMKQPGIYAIPKFIQAFVFVFVGFFMIRKMDILGAAIANTIANIAYLLMVMTINYRLKTITTNI